MTRFRDYLALFPEKTGSLPVKSRIAREPRLEAQRPADRVAPAWDSIPEDPVENRLFSDPVPGPLEEAATAA
jgi:hypothetical protein